MSIVDFLNSSFYFLIPEDVIIFTTESDVFEGYLTECDQYSNLILFNASQKHNKDGKLCKTEHQICFVRGDQITFISPSKKPNINSDNMI